MMSNPEVIWPQRLFKRLHKMQEKAEMRSRSRQDKKEEVENEKMDVQEKSKKERSSSTSSSDDEEWTVLNDKKDETKTVEIPIQIDQKEAEAGGAPIYPAFQPLITVFLP